MAGRILGSLRQADWLDSQRVRGYAVLLGLASLALLVNSYLKAMGPAGSDFLAFWGAGRVTAGGDPAAAYDLGVQERVQTATGAHGWFAFVNPPPFLFLAAPLGWLPFPLAWLLWVAAGFGIWAWSAIRAFPKLWLLVLVFPGALVAAGHGQTGFFTGALLIGGVVAVARGRPLNGGVLLGALIIKPHLALLVPFWLAAGGRWRAFAAAAGSAAGLMGLSWLVFGTETMLAYTESWEASAAIMRIEEPGFYLRMATLYGQLRLFAPAPWALAANGVLALAMIGLVMRSWRRFDGDPLQSGMLTLAATSLASPYLFNYDLPFLILPLLWLARQGLRDGFRSWEKAALVALYLAPYATRAMALPLGLNLMPLAGLAIVALVWTRPVGRRQNEVGQSSWPETSEGALPSRHDPA
jgi:hypothetical protein